MTFEVVVLPPAEQELGIAEESPEAALRWFDRMHQCIRGLSRLPKRCPLAPERGVFEVEVRQQLCGEDRVLFTIQGMRVNVVHVRHSARQRLTRDP